MSKTDPQMTAEEVKTVVKGQFITSSFRFTVSLVAFLLVGVGTFAGYSMARAERAVEIATEARDDAVAASAEAKEEARREADRIIAKERVTQIYLGKLLARLDAEGVNLPKLPEELQ